MFKRFKINPIWCSDEPVDAILDNFMNVNVGESKPGDNPAPGGGNNEADETDPLAGDPRFETPPNDDTNQNDDSNGDVENPGEDSDSNDSNDSNDSDSSDTNARFAELETQNKMLMELLVKGKKTEDEDANPDGDSSQLTDPFESEAFTNLADGMDWDETEQALMKTFLKGAFQFNKTTTIQEAQTAIPDIVNSQMTAAQKKEAIKTSFYSDNPDLKGKEQFVSMISSNVVNEFKSMNKPLDLKAILVETSKRAYELFNIQKETNDNNNSNNSNSVPARGKNPGFATPTGARKKTPKISRDAAMIQNILNLDK